MVTTTTKSKTNSSSSSKASKTARFQDTGRLVASSKRVKPPKPTVKFDGDGPRLKARKLQPPPKPEPEKLYRVCKVSPAGRLLEMFCYPVPRNVAFIMIAGLRGYIVESESTLTALDKPLKKGTMTRSIWHRFCGYYREMNDRQWAGKKHNVEPPVNRSIELWMIVENGKVTNVSTDELWTGWVASLSPGAFERERQVYRVEVALPKTPTPPKPQRFVVPKDRYLVHGLLSLEHATDTLAKAAAYLRKHGTPKWFITEIQPDNTEQLVNTAKGGAR